MRVLFLSHLARQQASSRKPPSENPQKNNPTYTLVSARNVWLSDMLGLQYHRYEIRNLDKKPLIAHAQSPLKSQHLGIGTFHTLVG